MSQNTIIIHAAGGGGTKVLKDVLSNGVKDILNVKHNVIDTSRRDIGEQFKAEDVFICKHQGLGGIEIDGAGSDRTKYMADIVHNVEEYMESKKYIKPVKGELHVVLYTASGGSGSMIGPVMVSHMLKKDMLVLPIAICDDSDYLGSDNALKSLDNLNKAAVSNKVALPIVTLLNKYDENTSIETAENNVNTGVCVFLNNLALYLADNTESLDYNDFRSLLKFDDNAKIKQVSHTGLYSLIGGETVIRQTEGDKVIFEDKPIVVRTIVNAEDKDESRNVLFKTSLHQKVGKVPTPLNAAMSAPVWHMYVSDEHIPRLMNRLSESAKKFKAGNSQNHNFEDLVEEDDSDDFF